MDPFYHLKRLLMPRFCAELAPERPFVVVGDIHGRADLLEQMVGIVARSVSNDCPLVFVGDYVDRGEQSAEVLGLLLALQGGVWPGETVCLKGNHEAMMLDFLDEPEATGDFWLRNGGAHTLASFGVQIPDSTAQQGLRAARDQLRDALTEPTEAWLRGLPYCFHSGNVFVAHAGADPYVPLDQQEEQALLWGHPDFLQVMRRDDIWVAHGHFICEQGRAEHGRISVDTGGYATHRLTAALISDKTCCFMDTHTTRLPS